MRRFLVIAFAFFGAFSTALFANGPAESVFDSEQVLSELMAIPAKQIPHRLMEEAQGIVIVPNVIKIGFIAGARRGHGVILVRDPDGEWSLPQFVTLTGGSVGWQAGIQGTDVVLVFTTRRGVEGLMSGKFTVGVDASVTAGPIGREAAAGTDSTLRSEVFSYSRSRGLFAGVSLDGTALEIDHDSHAFFYGSPTGALPRRVPTSASDLRHFLAELTQRQGAPAVPSDRPNPAVAPAAAPAVSSRLVEGLRRSLNRNSDQLQGILSPEWRPYLALPRELQEPGVYPQAETLAATMRHFAHVNSSADYRNLTQRPEFQNTYEILREYEQAVSASRHTVQLPPPPQGHLRRD